MCDFEGIYQSLWWKVWHKSTKNTSHEGHIETWDYVDGSSSHGMYALISQFSLQEYGDNSIGVNVWY